MNLITNCFIKNFFWSKTLIIVANMANETGFLPYSLVNYITCLLDRDYMITYGKSSCIPLNNLSSVYIVCPSAGYLPATS